MTGYEIGTELPELSFEMTHERVLAYADASGDHNPIHVDDEAARRAGLPGVIAHGMLSMGTLGTAATQWAGHADRIVELTCRFTRPVPVGDVLRVSGTIIAIDDGLVTVQANVRNNRDEPVLGDSTVRFLDKA
jgi:acyl dehydratase